VKYYQKDKAKMNVKKLQAERLKKSPPMESTGGGIAYSYPAASHRTSHKRHIGCILNYWVSRRTGMCADMGNQADNECSSEKWI